MKVRLPKFMPKTLAEIRANPVTDKQWNTALYLGFHGDKAQQAYAKATIAHFAKKMKPFSVERV